MIPVRHSTHDNAVKVSQHRFHRLCVVWWDGGQHGSYLAGLHIGQHRHRGGVGKDALEVGSYPIHQSVSVALKLGWRQIAVMSNGHGRIKQNGAE
jgi:hypothetical protein